MCLGVSWKSSFLNVLRVLDSIQIFAKHFFNRIIFCLGCLWFSKDVIQFKLFIGVFESIHLAYLVSDHCLLICINALWILSIFIWTSWFDSNLYLCKFEWIQSSYEKCLIWFTVLDIRINLYIFQIFYVLHYLNWFMLLMIQFKSSLFCG